MPTGAWRRHRRGAVAVALLLVSALAIAGCGSSEASGTHHRAEWAGKVIRIGAVYSTTGTGSTYGQPSILGAKLAVKMINAEGGVHGARIDLSVKNDNSVPAQSAAATTELITSWHALALLGPSLTNTAQAAHQVADHHQTVMMATSNTGPGIVGNCSYPCYPWVFRDSLGEEAAIPANIDEYAQSAHPSSAAVLYPASGDLLGSEQAQIAVDAFRAEHVTVAADVAYPTTGADLSASVSQAIATHPSALFLAGTTAGDLSQMIVDAHDQGYLGQILGGNTFNTSTVSSAAGTAGIGAQSAAAWYIGNAFPANTTFVKAYESAYNQTPDQFAAQAYTGIELLANAASTAHLTFTDLAQDRAQLLSSLENVTMETPLGPFSFTAQHDVSQPIWIVQMNGTGGFTLITSELENTG